MAEQVNPAFRNNLREILERTKDTQQQFETPERAGLDSFFPKNYFSNIAAMDVTERAFGVDEPITEGLGSYLQFEGKNMTPSEELSSVDSNTFAKMVKQGLVSADSKSGEVFRPSSILERNELFLSGDYSPSVLYDQSLGEKVAEFRNLERSRQSVESKIAGEGGFGAGILGGDPNLKPQYVGAELSGQNVSLDYISETFSKAIPVDQDPTENKEFMSLMKEYDPDRYDQIMRIKNNIKNVKSPYFDPKQAQEQINKLIGTTTDLGDGRKLVTINLDPANPEDFNTYSDIAAPGSPGYAGGQFTQLGIEFVPFIGMFDNVARSAVRLAGAGAAKIFGKDLDKIKVVCSSPCRLSSEGKKILQQYEKNGKIKEGMADSLEAQLKLRAENENVMKNLGKSSSDVSDARLAQYDELGKTDGIKTVGGTRPAIVPFDKNLIELGKKIDSGEVIVPRIFQQAFGKNSLFAKDLTTLNANQKFKVKTNLKRFEQVLQNKKNKLFQ